MTYQNKFRFGLCVVALAINVHAQKIGETVTFADSEWTVLRAGNAGSTVKPTSPFAESATTEGSFIFVVYKVKNTTKIEKSIFATPILVDSENREFNQYRHQANYLKPSAETIRLEALPSNIPKTFHVMYEVPKFSNGLKFQVRSLSIMTEYKLVSLGFDEEKNYKKAKTAFDTASSLIDYTVDAQYGGINFEAMMQQVKIAQSSGNDPEKGAQAYNAALVVLPNAIAEITENKRLPLVAALSAVREANAGKQWQTCVDKAKEVLNLDPSNTEVKTLLKSMAILVPIKGAAWTSPETGIEFVWVSALKLWVGKYEVTNGEYRKKAAHDSGSYEGDNNNNERRPVAKVNFDDAKAYAAWLTERDKPFDLRYRMPSETEWLSFAQCGDGRRYPWGNERPPKYGNYDDPGYHDGYVEACPVEQSGKNDWGLYGVGGNVWEACSVDSSGTSFGAWRGASWEFKLRIPDYLRCAYREEDDGSNRFRDRGFRLVLSR